MKGIKLLYEISNTKKSNTEVVEAFHACYVKTRVPYN